MVEDHPHDQTADGAASEAPVAAAPEPPIDAEALVQAAVRRIAESITPVPVLEPVGDLRPTAMDQPSVEVAPPDNATEAGEAVATPVSTPDAPINEPSAEAGPALAAQPELDLSAEPVAADIDGPPAEERMRAVADNHVPVDAPHETAAVSSTAPEGAAEQPAQPAETRGVLSGPWTVRRVVRLAGLAIAAYFGFVLFLILVYRFINPPTTTLIAYQWLTGTKIEQEWVPIEDISSNLLRAVVVSEDWGFCDHYGVDLDAIEKALELAGEGKVARGASTISMQVIKNLFLSQSKSYLRKAVEIPLTFAAEAVWTKSRMLEIYLNIAEWGPGVFGAEAAARHHFSKAASDLNQREAALLAAALPNPILRDAGDPGTRTARKASVIQQRMRAAGPVANCAMTGRQRNSDVRGDRDDGGSPGWQTTVKKRAGAD